MRAALEQFKPVKLIDQFEVDLLHLPKCFQLNASRMLVDITADFRKHTGLQ